MNIYCPGCGIKLPVDAWYNYCSEECFIRCQNKNYTVATICNSDNDLKKLKELEGE